LPNLPSTEQWTSNGARGTTATETHPRVICTVNEGIKLTQVRHGPPRAGSFGVVRDPFHATRLKGDRYYGQGCLAYRKNASIGRECNRFYQRFDLPVPGVSIAV